MRAHPPPRSLCVLALISSMQYISPYISLPLSSIFRFNKVLSDCVDGMSGQVKGGGSRILFLFLEQKNQQHCGCNHHTMTLYYYLLSYKVVASVMGLRFWHLLFSLIYKSPQNHSKYNMEQNQSFSFKSVLLRLISHISVTTPSANQNFQQSFSGSPYPSNLVIPIRR